MPAWKSRDRPHGPSVLPPYRRPKSSHCCPDEATPTFLTAGICRQLAGRGGTCREHACGTSTACVKEEMLHSLPAHLAARIIDLLGFWDCQALALAYGTWSLAASGPRRRRLEIKYGRRWLGKTRNLDSNRCGSLTKGRLLTRLEQLLPSPAHLAHLLYVCRHFFQRAVRLI